MTKNVTYVHAAGNRLHRGSRQMCKDCTPPEVPLKFGPKFRCAICDDGLYVCSCAYGHHNKPIRSAP